MSEQAQIVIVDGARTPVGDFGGAFKDVPAHELGAAAARAALDRSGVAPEDVKEVVMGCIGQVGPDAFNARRVALSAGLAVSVPAYTVNRLCGSGLQAIWSAAMQIRWGGIDVAPAVIRDAKLDPAKVNPYGGAIALGHPVGATGAILSLRVAKTLARRDQELGIVTMCIGGGQALAAMYRRAA